MRLRSRDLQFVIASVFLLLGTGCRATGPDIDRYRPPAAMVADDRVRRLFEMRSRVKEMGEAYSVLQQLRALVAEWTIAGTCGADGEGVKCE